MSTVFDSSALLAVVFRERGSEAAARALNGAMISAVNAAEVVSRLVDSGTGAAAARAVLLAFGLTIRPFDAALAIDAGLLRAATRALGLVTRRPGVHGAGAARAGQSDYRRSVVGGARSRGRNSADPLAGTNAAIPRRGRLPPAQGGS